MCVFGQGRVDGTGARLSPHSPMAAGEVNWQHLAVWEPKCPSRHLLFLPNPVPSHAPLPLVGAATSGTHMVTPVWLQAVNMKCVHVYVWYTGEDGGRQGRQTPSCSHRAKGNVGRQAGIFLPTLSLPSGRMGGRDGQGGGMEGGAEW